MEKETQLWKEESCGDRFWDGEGEVWWRVESKKIQGAASRVVVQGHSSQHSTTGLLGVRREVTFHTEPKLCHCSHHSQL